MKYYDGMGKDVTDYVEGLEKKIKEYEAQQPISANTVYDMDSEIKVYGSNLVTGNTFESEKPKPRRRKATK